MFDQNLTFIPYERIVAWENVARGMCLIASVFQGKAHASGIQRRSENELKELISVAINIMVEHFMCTETPPKVCRVSCLFYCIILYFIERIS